jgi:tRNA A37 threonylcarbamoyladenosine dehydratase
METEPILSADYANRFGGLGRLYGRGALERLRRAHVCVVGVGGVGSWVVEALARSGLGALTLIDADDVCVTNVNRQLPALEDTVGRPKVAVLAERTRRISPECHVSEMTEFFTRSNAEELLLPSFDFVVDAVDRMSTKAHLIHTCRERGLRVLTCGAAGGRRDPTQVRATDLGLAGQDELLRQTRRKLRRDYGWELGVHTTARPMGVPCVFSPEKPVFPWSDGTCAAEPEPGSSLRMDCASGFGAAVFVTGVFGFVAAAEVVRHLLADGGAAGAP